MPRVFLAFLGSSEEVAVFGLSEGLGFVWKYRSPAQPFSLFKAFLRGFQCGERDFTPALMSPLCACRSGTGKLWQIPRTSAGEHRSLWKMPNSLVSRRAVFTALACLPQQKMLTSSFSVYLSSPASFILKLALMFGLDSWYLSLITVFSLCPAVSCPIRFTESQNCDYFFFSSPSAAEFSSADLVENAGCAVCWGLALAGCILYSAVSSGCDLLYCVNSILCLSSLEVDAAWGSSQSLD